MITGLDRDEHGYMIYQVPMNGVFCICIYIYGPLGFIVQGGFYMDIWVHTWFRASIMKNQSS